MRDVILIGVGSALGLSMTSGWLITGIIFHRFQSRTPESWRPESWRSHLLAMGSYAFAGAIIGAAEFRLGILGLSVGNILFSSLLLWLAFTMPVLMVISTYVRIHIAVAIGLMLEWLIFVVGVSAACGYWLKR